MNFVDYSKQTLYNATVYKKIDGVRVHFRGDSVVSRTGKPLYNVTTIPNVHVAEVFTGNWETSVSAVKTHKGTPVPREHVYSLVPTVDPRLFVGEFEKLTPEQVDILFTEAKTNGYEGLVIHSEGQLYKVKNTATYDVPVVSVIEGTGKYAGKMGALVTPMGKVGTGFTDAQRGMQWPVGTIIEVECMELTPQGSFRHPRFVRIREDKM